MDVSQQKGLRMRCEQGSRGELVVEAGHGHAMFAEAPEHRAVRDPDRRDAQGARTIVDTGKPSQKFGQLLANGLRSLGCAERPSDHSLVRGGHAGEERLTPIRRGGKSPLGRLDPPPVRGQPHLPDAVRDVHRETASEQAQCRQGPGWLVRKRPLKHQDRTVVSQAPNLAGKAPCRRRVQVERVVGRVAGDHCDVDLEGHGAVDRGPEATVGLGERLAAVVQIGEVGDADHDALRSVLARSATSTLSR
jgi:hypothetical protein